jgi:Ca-activated chloride channel family protein
MDAQDVEPDRLTAAKRAANAVMDRLGGDRVGLVVFAGDARIRFPLTTDFAAARQVVETLQAGAIFVEGGTNAALGLELAIELLAENPESGKLILLITDGDDLGGDPAAAALQVQESGAELLVAGVGTAQGGTIPVFDATRRGEVPKLDEDGQPIITRLNEGFLRALAAASGGRYLGSDLAIVPGAIDGRLRALERSQIESRPTILPIERYQEFAAAALGLLVLAALAERFARLPIRAGAAFAALALLFGACQTNAHRANEEGREALRNGDAGLAIEKFLEVQVDRPDDPQVALNLAAAFAANGQYEEAIRSARRALGSHRPETRARAYSSIGHHQFSAERLPESLDAFRRALLEEGSNDAARHDYEVVLRLLFPEAQATEPSASPTVESAGTPTPPSGQSSPGPGGPPGPGVPTQVSGTPTPGGSGPGGQTPSPNQPQSVAELDRQLRAIDAEVERLLREAGEVPTAQEALEILRLLRERSELSQLRNSFLGGGGPKDY